MYFVNDDHAKNYWALMKHYEYEMPDHEYEACCYVLGLPETYEKFKEADNKIWPFEWAFDFDDEEGTLHETEALADLSSGMRQLVSAAHHMYNGQEFHLNSGLRLWNQQEIEVFMQACKIRGLYHEKS